MSFDFADTYGVPENAERRLAFLDNCTSTYRRGPTCGWRPTQSLHAGRVQRGRRRDGPLARLLRLAEGAARVLRSRTILRASPYTSYRTAGRIRYGSPAEVQADPDGSPAPRSCGSSLPPQLVRRTSPCVILPPAGVPLRQTSAWSHSPPSCRLGCARNPARQARRRPAPLCSPARRGRAPTPESCSSWRITGVEPYHVAGAVGRRQMDDLHLFAERRRADDTPREGARRHQGLYGVGRNASGRWRPSRRWGARRGRSGYAAALFQRLALGRIDGDATGTHRRRPRRTRSRWSGYAASDWRCGRARTRGGRAPRAPESATARRSSFPAPRRGSSPPTRGGWRSSSPGPAQQQPLRPTQRAPQDGVAQPPRPQQSARRALTSSARHELGRHPQHR